MLKKIFFAFAVLSLFPLHVLSQQAPKKVLVIVQSRVTDRFNFSMALWRSMELQKAGIDVRVVFQGEAVAFFLGKDKFSGYEKIGRSTDILLSPADTTIIVSTECQAGPLAVCASTSCPGFTADTSNSGTSCVKTLVGGAYVPSLVPANPVDKLQRSRTYSKPARKGERPEKITGAHGQITWQLLDGFIAAKIPYTICSLSAAQLGIYEQLKALGLPLSEDPGAPVAIAPYLLDNYQLVSY